MRPDSPLATTHAPRAATGFTLFEIAVSSAIAAVAITSVALAFPVGLHAQQAARYRLYAAAKAVELIDLFANAQNATQPVDVEATAAWDVTACRRAYDNDLETRMANPRFGCAPLPTRIARRLDSPDDEIQRILDAGGLIYYGLPMASMDLGEQGLQIRPPNEVQRLVFAVVGSAQANAMHVFPWKAWPYHALTPSPPVFGPHNLPGFLPAGGAATVQWTWTIDSWGGYGSSTNQVIEPLLDPREDALIGASGTRAMQVVMRGSDDPTGDLANDDHEHDFGFAPYALNVPGNTPTGGPPTASFPNGQGNPDPLACDALHARNYLRVALWYARRIGLPDDCYATMNPATPLGDPDPVPAGGWNPDATAAGRLFARGMPVEPYRQARAMRFIAHAATCLTRWYDLAKLTSGVEIEPVTIDGVESPKVTVTHQHILYWHESALRLAMGYAARFPYDWGSPRPIERATMMDHPLLEWDLFPGGATPIATGDTYAIGGPRWACRQWRPLAAGRVTNGGRSWTVPNQEVPGNAPGDAAGAAFWGDPTHATLTAPFAPDERCRELVFWSVDWKAYVDFETAPAAAIDAGRWPLCGPIGGGFANRMNAGVVGFQDAKNIFFPNPEFYFAFGGDVTGLPDGTEFPQLIANMTDRFGNTINNKGGKRDIANGVYGADRNFNLVLDRGPVPTTVRMRAQPVARYAFYDPRLALVIR